MADQGNAAVIRALFGELDRLGVREFCVAAGARNAPIIAALMERGPGCVVRHFFEERSAAFFALGRIMVDRIPVAMVTTSGTAAGELLPAMMEAHYQGLPLVAITADRPARYRGSGAPQAVEQKGIFGKYAGREWEGEWAADSARGSTMHFNVCLEEGMIQSGEAAPLPMKAGVIATRAASSDESKAWSEFWNTEGGVLVVVGGLHPEDAASVSSFLLALNAPVVAEVTSNLLHQEELLHLLVLGGEKALEALKAQRVLRIGAVPSWRWWRDLDDRPEVKVLNVSRAPFRGMARTHNVAVVPWETLDQVQFGQPVPTEGISSLGNKLTGLLDQFPKSEPAWVRHLSQMIPAGATVFLGNSLPIREWNLAAVRPKEGTRFFANRGANGIDGLVSAGLGVGAEAEDAWIVVGDLSAFYDLSAPWILPQLKNRRWRIVVINNGGGKIFSRVGWLRDLPPPVREVVENRHTQSFEHWAKLWNLEYRCFDDPGELINDGAPCAVWEIIPDAAQTESFWAAWK